MKTNAQRVLAILIIIGCYFLARQPHITAASRSALSARFAFAAMELPPAPGKPLMTVDQLPIHPDVKHMRAWVSAAGAGVTLGDLDGDGLPNDVCFVDTRTDAVVVMPVPGTPQRYAPIVLEPPRREVDQPVQFPTGCIVADINEDGRQDVVVYYATRPPVAFLRHAAGYVAQELVPGNEVWATAAGIVADLDGDGHLDLMFGNYFPDGTRMYDPNDSKPVRLNDSLGHAANGGGIQMLLFTSATQGDTPSVRFRRVANALPDGIGRGWTLALAAADLDGDLLPEIYIANDFGPDRLLHNRSRPGQLEFALLVGQRTLTMPKSKVLGYDSYKGMGVDIADLNEDGRLDIAVSNITSDFAFQESNFTFMNTGDTPAMRRGIAPFIDKSEPLGLSRSGFSWDVRFGDFDNDGSLELIQATGFMKGEINQYPELHELAIANDALIKYPAFWALYDGRHDLAGHEPNRFWVRGPDGRYLDIAQELGITTTEVSRGIATADVDGDGALDFAIANQWEPSYFYKNHCPHCGNFLGLHLRFPLAPLPQAIVHPGHPSTDTPSRPAIGAHVRVVAPSGRAWVGFVDASNGHSGKRAPDLHFGLGTVHDAAALDVQVSYRDPVGHIQHTTLNLTPGWHTVLLPWSTQEIN
jgi:hypothetical protein